MAKGTILITGAAGFIGSTLVDKLLDKNYRVVGVDNLNDFYDPKIKLENIKGSKKSRNFSFYKEDISNFEGLSEIFLNEKPDIIIHLAARAGVRPSIDNPKLYGEVNVLGTVKLLKLSADYKVKKFIFGSSSSVYGNSKRLPFREDDSCDSIISPYGASKRSAEFFIESFHKSRGLNCVILRFFTVYGPRGRLDMAPALFTKAIMEGTTINQFGDGTSSRDYTYVDDIVDGIVKTIGKDLGFEIINLGNNHPVSIRDFTSTLERTIKQKAKIVKRPKQMGDVEKTWANVVKANELLGWTPKVELLGGLKKYLEWLKNRK
jgi:UDP-glucuronate 4-epimerase